MSEEVAMDTTVFVNQGGRTDHRCARLRRFMARLRLTPCVERAVESTHRDVHREVKRAPRHSHAFVSLVGRAGDMAETAMSASEPFNEFAELLSQLHSPRDCVVALGLGSHPASLIKCSTLAD